MRHMFIAVLAPALQWMMHTSSIHAAAFALQDGVVKDHRSMFNTGLHEFNCIGNSVDHIMIYLMPCFM